MKKREKAYVYDANLPAMKKLLTRLGMGFASNIKKGDADKLLVDCEEAIDGAILINARSSQCERRCRACCRFN